MRDFYLILNTTIAVALFALGLASYINNRKPILNRLFFAFTFCVSVWVVMACVSNDTRNNSIISLYGNYLVFLFSYLSVYLLLWFSVLTTSANKLLRLLKLLTPALLVMALLSATPLVVAGVKQQGSVYAVEFGPLIIIYVLLLLIQIIATIWILTIGVKNSRGRKQNQIKVIWRSLVVAIPILLITQFIAPAATGSFEITDAGILVMVLPVVSLYFSVIRHGLFDIHLAVVRVMAYTLSLATLSVIYYYVAYLFSLVLFSGRTDSSVGISPVNIGLALTLAFLFQPIKRFFDKITNRLFYKDNYNTDDFFARLNKTLSFTTDLRGLLERVSYEIAKTLKSEQVFFFIYTNADGNYISAGTDHHNHLPKHDAILIEQESQGEDKIISASLLDENDPIRRMMISHRIELILPLMQDDAVIGYLCLGNHLTSGYTNRDIKALNTLSDEFIIAIKNALSVNEIREINATLQQRIANATKELRSKNAILLQLDRIKDEFISMASHQLRTPLTSVKGYLSMVIEGDVGKITPSQKQLLDQAFMSSENMVHLINDFLNVSRIQAGKFIIDKSPVDLSLMVEQEINSLRPNAEVRGMKFEYKKPKKFPIIDLDDSKTRQVIMNFADNAIYYSHDNSTITINLSVEGNEVVFTVKDTGIGVPAKEREHLFSKFYRASNAKVQRPDGTGVGIFLAKRVIDEQDGKIIFESTEGKGSTFGFRLPIPPTK